MADTAPVPPELVRELLATARRAGAAVMKIYATDFDVESKGDSSPVTEADLLSENIILEALEDALPDTPIVAEEAYHAGRRPDVSGGRFWLVDALDGTKEFVNHTDEFTVNIGLIVDKVPRFGIVYAPALETAYWGDGTGAYRQIQGGQPTSIGVRKPAADGLVVMTSRSHRSSEKDFLADYRIKSEKHAGSSIKFCLIACGEADFYPRLGPTSEWDTAAGHAVLTAAGGTVRTLDGAPLGYGKPDFRNPFFVARGVDE